MNMKIFAKYLLFVFTIFIASYSIAATSLSKPQWKPHWYAGMGYMLPSSNKDAWQGNHINDNGDTITTTESIDIKTGAGASLFLGYRANKYWGTEFTVVDEGKTEVNNVHTVTKTTGSPVITTTKGSGTPMDYTVTGIGYYPLGNSPFTLYMRAGMGYYNANFDQTGTTTTQQQNSGSEFVYGFGTQYHVTSKISVRADYLLLQAWSINDGLDDGNFMLTGTYSF